MALTSGPLDVSGTAGHRPSRAATSVPTAWDNAFYRFAECIRELTSGAINHKAIYGLVGSKGRYINHKSAVVRRRTAASLSRLMHSTRYSADMRERYANDPCVFSEAGLELTVRVAEAVEESSSELLDLFLGHVWHEIHTGLCHEARAGREDMNLIRVDREYAVLSAWCRRVSERGEDPLAWLVSMYLRIMAFGHLDDNTSRMLVPASPTEPPTEQDMRAAEREELGRFEAAGQALLARFVGREKCVFSGVWCVGDNRPFTIGRYTDCDIIESFPYVSRRHCSIISVDGSWYVRDEGSRHGTCVFRPTDDGTYRPVYDSLGAGGSGLCQALPPFELVRGDILVLAGYVRFLFGGLVDPSRGAGEAVVVAEEDEADGTAGASGSVGRGA